jgi:hypothetical protein
MTRSFLLIFSVLFLIMSSCNSCEKNRLDVDVSNIKVSVKIERMEKELFKANPDQLKETNANFIDKYGDLYEAYISEMIQAGTPYDPNIALSLAQFVTNEGMSDIAKEIEVKFPNLNKLKRELVEAFKHFKYYYSNAKVPTIVTYNSGLNYGVYLTEDMIGIGLDMYLGPDNRLVKQVPVSVIPSYLKSKMKSSHILIDVVRGWYEYNYMEENIADDFLGNIIYHGKLMYAMDAMMPKVSDHRKMRYSRKELKWCERNEQNIWKFLIDEKMLYIKDKMEINKFIVDGPFTSSLPQDSPSRVGVWLGWQMVRAYMDDHQDVSFKQLMKIKNPKKILASYNPKK